MPATTPDQDSGFGSSSDDDLDVWGATRLVPPLSGNGAATSGTSGHGGGFLGRIAAGLGRGTTGTVPLPRWCAPGGEPGAECTPADGNGGFKLGSTLRFLWRVYDTGTHGVLDRLLLQQCSDNACAMCAAASSPARSAVAMAAALLLTSVRHTISVAKLPRVITCLVRLADHVSLAYVSGDQVRGSCHICAGVCVCVLRVYVVFTFVLPQDMHRRSTVAYVALHGLATAPQQLGAVRPTAWQAWTTHLVRALTQIVSRSVAATSPLASVEPHQRLRALESLPFPCCPPTAGDRCAVQWNGLACCLDMLACVVACAWPAWLLGDRAMVWMQILASQGRPLAARFRHWLTRMVLLAHSLCAAPVLAPPCAGSAARSSGMCACGGHYATAACSCRSAPARMHAPHGRIARCVVLRSWYRGHCSHRCYGCSGGCEPGAGCFLGQRIICEQAATATTSWQGSQVVHG